MATCELILLCKGGEGKKVLDFVALRPQRTLFVFGGGGVPCFGAGLE